MMILNRLLRACQEVLAVCACVVVLSLSAPVWAEGGQASGESAFRQGVEAFQAGEHERALRHLEKARNQGLDSTALHYNLAVVHFRLEHYVRARRHFQRLLETPHRDLARYNLGLVSLGEGDSEAAARWFRRVAAHAESGALQRKASERLRSITGSTDEAPSTELSGLVAVGAGYEDNVSRLPDTAPTSVSDSSTDLLASGRIRHGDLNVSAAAYKQRFHSVSGFDTEYGRAGVDWQVSEGRNRFTVGGQQAYVRYGGSSRFWISSIDGDYRRGRCLADKGRCGVRFEAGYVRPYADYASREGTRFRLTTDYGHRYGDWRSRLQYRGEVNDRRDFESDPLFISYSPTRHRLALRQRYVGFPALELEAELRYRYSNYPDRFRLGSTATGKRRDHRYQLSVKAEWRISGHWGIALRGRHLRNESSLERFDYRSYLAEVSFLLRL